MEKLTGSMSWYLANASDRPSSRDEIMTAHRARLAIEEDARAQQRQLDLEEQRSQLNSPDVRIRKWEKVHGLRLPSDAAHPVLEVIAVGTRLTLAEIRAEQQARRVRDAGPSTLE